MDVATRPKIQTVGSFWRSAYRNGPAHRMNLAPGKRMTLEEQVTYWSRHSAVVNLSDETLRIKLADFRVHVNGLTSGQRATKHVSESKGWKPPTRYHDAAFIVTKEDGNLIITVKPYFWGTHQAGR